MPMHITDSSSLYWIDWRWVGLVWANLPKKPYLYFLVYTDLKREFHATRCDKMLRRTCIWWVYTDLFLEMNLRTTLSANSGIHTIRQYIVLCNLFLWFILVKKLMSRQALFPKTKVLLLCASIWTYENVSNVCIVFKITHSVPSVQYHKIEFYGKLQIRLSWLGVDTILPFQNTSPCQMWLILYRSCGH